MCKLWNRIHYGKSNTPKYIENKNKWLYKNKWIPDGQAYDILSGHKAVYTYALHNEFTATFGTTDNFNKIVWLVVKYPTRVQFSDISQFNSQQLAIIVGIQQFFLKKKQEKIQSALEDMSEQFEDSIKE